MTDNQELIKALAKLGYESYIKSQPSQIDIVQIVIDPEDFISGRVTLDDCAGRVQEAVKHGV